MTNNSYWEVIEMRIIYIKEVDEGKRAISPSFILGHQQIMLEIEKLRSAINYVIQHYISRKQESTKKKLKEVIYG